MWTGGEYDFGGFDSRFLGITLRFPDKNAWDDHQAYLDLHKTIAIQQYRLRHPGKEKAKPTEIFRNLELVADSPWERELEENQWGKMITEDPERGFAFLAVNTSFVHERRHFHDWLLTPMTANLMRARTEFCFNLDFATTLLLFSNPNVIPVPLSNWIDKDEAQQQAAVSRWETLLQEDRGPDFRIRIANLGERMIGLIKQTRERYHLFHNYFDNVERLPFGVPAFFEASATLVQTQEVRNLFGTVSQDHFLHTMLSRKGPQLYGEVPRILAYFSDHHQVEVDIAESLVTWCLLGNTAVDKENSHPFTRLLHVGDYVKDHGFPDRTMSARTIFQELDAEFVEGGYIDCLKQSVALNEKILRKFAMDPKKAHTDFAQTAYNAFSWYERIHRYMVKTFLADPDSYTKPLNYLDSPQLWLEPPIRYLFYKPFYRVKRSQLKNYGGYPDYFPASGSREDVSLRSYIEFRGPRILSEKTASNWTYLSEVSDLLFADFNRDDPELNFAREKFRGDGIHCLEVFS